MLAGIELENYAIGHEMSNRQSEKQSFPNTNLDRLGHIVCDLQGGMNCIYSYLRSFTFLPCINCIFNSLEDIPYLEHFQTMDVHSLNSWFFRI